MVASVVSQSAMRTQNSFALQNIWENHRRPHVPFAKRPTLFLLRMSSGPVCRNMANASPIEKTSRSFSKQAMSTPPMWWKHVPSADGTISFAFSQFRAGLVAEPRAQTLPSKDFLVSSRRVHMGPLGKESMSDPPLWDGATKQIRSRGHIHPAPNMGPRGRNSGPKGGHTQCVLTN